VKALQEEIKKGFGQCSQREGFSSKRAFWERYLELMGLKSREEGELGETFPLLSRVPKLTEPRFVPEEVLVVMRSC
jgi:hypothetical protein